MSMWENRSKTSCVNRSDPVSTTTRINSYTEHGIRCFSSK
jgi:hypothetical protein